MKTSFLIIPMLLLAAAARKSDVKARQAACVGLLS